MDVRTSIYLRDRDSNIQLLSKGETTLLTHISMRYLLIKENYSFSMQ
ncbi:hypothetical protein APHWI1_0099 [Anaplasma phagocytophilum str. ApWI1]|uniref:Uncharacterized protein n=1 Tax=Anaplasma phagocytophilum str. ApWI1 TaxID=1359155 RepID=A0A0F3Q1S1_ANAPH|nr:hypothetical protein [Anaplasma phagocytophilum]KJV59961.1 hypothetical protein APHWEB_1384 [Anaplasma phagocytophilum str. Webster]KJV82713.1 hypothetical protein APHHGE2_0897 [Anaplasma phagocytophilum str. HGE2]KJV84829.1 hypothetical protein APHWI1_0130 [Anaplasma phagocytophilum str. ApWI1]KJV86551.1 hypothetical protein APHNYW_1350 [Anaplasma phagocytophilum str. ApNYW]KJV98841.1 hypothetical protein OTSANNIE_0899 [Anaplasma phagocytophilum str. Annie]